jgi:hypothetical protein
MARSFIFKTFDHEGLRSYLHIGDFLHPDLYPSLIWRLTEGLMRYDIPRFHRAAGYVTDEPYAMVDWEFEVEPERGPELGEIRGFVPARSSVRIHPPPGPWEVAQAKKAGLWELWGFGNLRDVMKGLSGDATEELNLFALAQGPDRLLAALGHPTPPSLADALGPTDIFVDLVIAEDREYADVLLIQSHSDLSAKLDPLVAEYNAAIEDSEQGRDPDMKDFLKRMETLLNPDED